MKPHVATLALLSLVAGCSGDEGGSPAPVATPSPSPSPTPSPSPSPSPTPTPEPTTSPAAYLKFADVYVFRQGAGITLQSACSSFAFQSQPPAVLPASAFGQGLSFRFVLTPGVWAVGGEVSVGFDGRNADPASQGTEAAYSKLVGADTLRFAITQPVAGGAGFDYVRLATVSAPVQGLDRLYQCATGIPTLPADLAAAPSGVFGRTAVVATAYVRDGAAARAYALGGSVVSLAADVPARRVTVSLRLVGKPSGGGADIDLGTFTATAPIDPGTGNYVANLSSADRTVTGTISGRLFGPQAIELGAAFGGSVAATTTTPAYTFAGAVYGAR
jgi:hypothetical protein